MTSAAAPSASRIPEGSAALFFIQMCSTLGFAVLYQTLVLYATRHLGLKQELATQLVGVFGAFNYGLHLFGGWMGGRLMSNRMLFVGGMALQVLGCAALATGSLDGFYLGLALFLTGSGLNVTCLNMMLTQRFHPDDTRREAAFLWNYAGMNVGFFIGYTVAGALQGSEDYRSMFLFATAGNVGAIVLALANWRTLADRDTPLLQAGPARFRSLFAAGLAILLGLVPVLWWLLVHPGPTNWLVKGICAAVALVLVVVTVRHPDGRERGNMWAYLILALGSLVFWTLYQLSPNGLQLFAVNNVDLRVGGFKVEPQWVQNINTVVIVIGGPLLAWWFARLRERGWRVDVPQQFALAVVLIGLGYLALPVGIAMADAQGRTAFVWLFLNYVLMSVGELLISPVGYAMIGQLAPRRYQGPMMGAWMLVTGLASLLAGDLSGLVPEAAGTDALATNAFYSQLFARLGWFTVAAGVVLGLLVPVLRRLIRPAPRVAEGEAAAAAGKAPGAVAGTAA